jgi:hypothetical protein
MSIPILTIIALALLLIVSQRVRFVFFHPKTHQFLIIVAVIVFLSVLGGLGYAVWKYWWPMYMEIPIVEWTDTTLEQDKNPETPRTGGPSKPTIIQVR